MYFCELFIGTIAFLKIWEEKKIHMKGSELKAIKGLF